MSGEPALMSAVAVAKAIAGKKFSSREVTQSCLDRIAQWQPRVNAFMSIEADEALAAADTADAALAKGQNLGVELGSLSEVALLFGLPGALEQRNDPGLDLRRRVLRAGGCQGNRTAQSDQ